MIAPRTLFDALRDNPAWLRVYLARSASLLGTWLNTLAIVHLLGEGQYALALPLALVFVLKQAPITLLGPFAGVLADRYDRRRIMIWCDGLSALVVLGFLFAEPGGSHLFIYALTLLQVSITTFFMPAYRAVVPDLVREDDLVAANTIGAATWSAMFAVGTALGGVVLYAFGWEVAIVLDAATYIVSGILIWSVRDERTRQHVREKQDRDDAPAHGVRSGLRYINAHPRVRHLLLTKTVWGTFGALTLFLTLLGATAEFQLGDSADLGISFLWFCRAIGTGLGPFVARRFGRGDPYRLRLTIVMGFALAIGGYVALTTITVVWLAGLVVLIAHLGGSAVWVMSTVLLQQTVPSEYRGRTFATELALVMFTSSASYLVYASAIDNAGVSVRDTMLVAAAVTAGFALIWSAFAIRRTASNEC